MSRKRSKSWAVDANLKYLLLASNLMGIKHTLQLQSKLINLGEMSHLYLREISIRFHAELYTSKPFSNSPHRVGFQAKPKVHYTHHVLRIWGAETAAGRNCCLFTGMSDRELGGGCRPCAGR